MQEEMLNTKEKAKNTNIEKSELSRKRYQDIIITMKKVVVKKENEVHDTRNNAKDQMERKNVAAAAEAESTLVDAEAQRDRKKKHEAQQQSRKPTGGIAQHENRRQGRKDVYTPWK